MITGLDLYDAFGDPNTIWDEGLYMTVWNVPKYITDNIEALPRRIYCNKEMIVPLEVSFLNIIDRGLTRGFKTFDGCFNVRPIRGYEKQVKELLAKGQIEKAMIYMSIHSWGTAIDVNAAWNRLGEIGEMPEEFARCFIEAGFDWGGYFKRKDSQHFQLSYIREEAKTYRP